MLGDEPLGERVISETRGTVDGRMAFRRETEATGEGLFPQGLIQTRWIVEANGRTLVARTYDVGPRAYSEKQEILDAMVASLVLEGS